MINHFFTPPYEDLKIIAFKKDSKISEKSFAFSCKSGCKGFLEVNNNTMSAFVTCKNKNMITLEEEDQLESFANDLLFSFVGFQLLD
jgi:hypothetical protein